MRKIFTLLLLLAGLYTSAQQYNNEWIKFEQTYYKVKVVRAGVYRIPKAVLDAAGIGNADVRNYEIWRNGEKVPYYPTVSSGVLPANGYIEFYGEANDGKPDKPLYRNPAYQHSEKRSLQTDTAVYFVSVNNNQSGNRVTEVTNNVAGNVLPVEPYFMYSMDTLFMRSNLSPHQGFAGDLGTFVYSSSYDMGEVFSSRDIAPSSPFSASMGPLYVYSSGPNSALKFGAAGGANNARSLKVKVNGTEVKDTVMDYFNDLITTTEIPTSLIASGTANVEFVNLSGVSNDKMVASHCVITYPREFNFNNQANFRFTLPARSGGYFLQITNFNNGGAPPVLYDLTNNERFTGDLSVAGKIQFALPGTANDRQLVLVSEDASNITTVTEFIPRVFTNFLATANQGNYLIISNPVLYTGTSGNNPVIDYKNYRESAAGGGYKVLVADINELVDQFGFGIKMHPLSVRNFIRYARRYFAQPLKNVFLIGRGMNYAEYQRGLRQQNFFPLTEQLNLVPTFGNPASDNLLSAEDITRPFAGTPIGRLSVVSGKEIETYLEKVKEYELVQETAPNTLSGKEWMKNVVHITGSSESHLGIVLCNFMNSYRQIIEDTLFGGKVTTFCKESANPIEQVSSVRLAQMFAEGITFLTYFGHSSSSTLDFNIDNPEAYSNQGKYPVFFVNGCNAGNFFNYGAQRLSVNETLSEKFVLAKQRGTIAFVASTHFGVVNYLNFFLLNLYKSIGRTDYDKTLGETLNAAMTNMYLDDSVDFYVRMHAEEITLNGDPAIRLNTQKKPDYVVEESSIRINPAFISLAEKTFELKVKVVNLGKAVADSITLEIKQQYPNGTTGILFRQKIRGIRYADSVTLEVPIIATRDKGQSKILVSIDADQNVDEIAENNNSTFKDIFIYEDEARPIYPYNYAITNNANQRLYASTANPLSVVKTYVMELDTTVAFNSSLKVRKTVTTSGGVLEFDHGLTFIDSTVYYWRVSPNAPTEADLRWNGVSFMYVNGTVDGFNQSTYDQHKESDLNRIFLDSASKQWKYGTRTNNFFIRNGVFPSAANQASDFTVSINGSNNMESVCDVSGLVFYVIDPVTLRPWFNAAVGQPGQYGSFAVCGHTREHQFQFNYTPADTATRRKVVEFMDLIPSGHYVVVNNIFHQEDWRNTYAPQLMADTSFLGSNNSIYHRLLEQGFTMIDSMHRNRSFIFLYQKDRQGFFVPKFTLSLGIGDRIRMYTDVLTPDTVGVITSPRFGPAKQWNQVIWQGSHLEDPSNDNPVVKVIGIDTTNVETVLYTLDRNTHSMDISSVDAKKYPYIQLVMRNIDSVQLTPYQLKYWRILYDPVPEGALAANLYLTVKDTVEVGEPLKFGIAFKNVSNKPFDSLRVKANVIDKNNITHTVPLSKYKPLAKGDTIRVEFEAPTKSYTENSTLFVEVNPDNDQPEQHHFNNFLFKNFYVRPDNTSPLLDVTFDGVHILNMDIVSAKPHIQIKLKDEAKYMLLTDSTITSVEIRNKAGVSRTYNFDGDTLRFTPATSGSDNTATIDFYPAFLNAQPDEDGDEYELIVKGRDASGNIAGTIAYRVQFKVISKPMISNLLNYPNPFSTSTAFVFTITGFELPQNLRIQILTVTGKIVREITMGELGNLRIGRNITEFKWDGTDQYGQKLANGVYLYRVITSMNGMPMEKYRAKGDDTDKYFNNGYGKMYLMR
jgi:hypothetical protein